jgi:hypothetical protein
MNTFLGICSRHLYRFFSLFDFSLCLRSNNRRGRQEDDLLFIRYTKEPPGVDSCDYLCCILPQSGDCDRAEQPRSALAKRLQPRHTVSPTEQSFVFVAACFLFSVDNGPCHENIRRGKDKLLICLSPPAPLAVV